jgi:optic atrophy protein 1
MNDKERLARLQEEIMNTQLKYQKELEKYEKENKELKKQLLLQRERLGGGKIRKIKVSYSKRKNENIIIKNYRNR